MPRKLLNSLISFIKSDLRALLHVALTLFNATDANLYVYQYNTINLVDEGSVLTFPINPVAPVMKSDLFE